MSASEQMTPELQTLAEALKAGERAALGRAITLVESKRPDHEDQAQQLLLSLTPATGKALRIGITGVPGVGKSTTIDTFGRNLTEAGHKVAVLAVDPTSQRSGGSILGDKTRMTALASDQNAFIRPSPTGSTLGGVTRRTRETMLLCEAAGFDIIIVETVGIGQSETAVADMVDFFLVLMLPGAGDELQGIKKGVLEIADMIAVNKADGDNAARAVAAASEYRAAFNILTPQSPNWAPPVITVSGLKNQGLDTLWSEIERHREVLSGTGEFDARRKDQRVRWMWAMLEERMMTRFRQNETIKQRLPGLEAQVSEGRLTPVLAVRELLESAEKA
ncbi:MAG: methylmalonyl Co-A mutase-associated GTPase MeaB [Alphaproteobacteria bacterium]|nr:methylmalonyl Co-A mutase-associated GTPase MeaB [Alphaproteobacteria bacterium]